ncbi:hypothetical protein GXW83_03500 [Streptacidiphilus sp. PB12-B1b]|uniref:hypothetical protein n=1 Tax=Streptacidiphilus sp. PB12-B1b TaxID=2705012 RepID=UPI0015FD2276|nr:hypothetical protein [Streptacidiphilus sp. PB12-B1b]QMU74965.1 hypothetical protein GXW83_03500 [Streptacidiphilus sp. PB12-B1b]
MNIAAPVLPKTDAAPAADRVRVSLAQAAQSGDSASAPLLGRVLPSSDRQRAEVAAFQSSI